MQEATGKVYFYHRGKLEVCGEKRAAWIRENKPYAEELTHREFNAQRAANERGRRSREREAREEKRRIRISRRRAKISTPKKQKQEKSRGKRGRWED